MSSVIIAGDVSGSVTLQAPSAAGSTVVNLPSTLGNTGTSSFATTDASGNLGLGVTPSAWASGWKALQMQGGSLVSPTADFIDVVQNAYYDGAWKYKSTAAASNYYQNGGAHYWTTAASGTAGSAISFTQAMTLDASGNLGVGITNPNRRFHAYGSGTVAQLESSNANVYLNFKTSSGDVFIGEVGTAFYVETGGSERMRIDSSGNLLVGTTTAVTTNVAGVMFAKVGTQGRMTIGSTSTSAQDLAYFFNPNGIVGSIQTNGSSTSYVTSSDYRLKNTIAPMTGALDKVALLKPCTYKWNVDGSDGEGFIAHELAEVVPQCVTGEKDGTKIEQYEITPAVPATYDEEGNELTPAVEAVMGEREVPVYQGIDTSFLVATLTAAIKEQQALISSLTERLTALENK